MNDDDMWDTILGNGGGGELLADRARLENRVRRVGHIVLQVGHAIGAGDWGLARALDPHRAARRGPAMPTNSASSESAACAGAARTSAKPRPNQNLNRSAIVTTMKASRLRAGE